MLQHLHLMQVFETVDVYQISRLFFLHFCKCLILFVIAVTGFDLWGAVLAMGLVCTLYTALVG